MTNRIATSKDVGAALGLSASTVQGYARAKKIPFDQTPGGHRRFDVAEVQLALEALRPNNEGDDEDDIDLTGLKPLASGLGRGAAAPTSELARLNRTLRTVSPEPRPSVRDDSVAPSDRDAVVHVSALFRLAAASRSKTLTLTAHR